MSTWKLDKSPLGRHIAPWHHKRFMRELQKRYPKSDQLPKPDKDTICMHCGRNDQTFPSLDAILCPSCTRKLFKVSVSRVLDDPYLNNEGPACYFCHRKSTWMYKVSGRICQHCTATAAMNVREYVQGKRRHFRYR